jgi:hypothetical protein
MAKDTPRKSHAAAELQPLASIDLFIGKSNAGLRHLWSNPQPWFGSFSRERVTVQADCIS